MNLKELRGSVMYLNRLSANLSGPVVTKKVALMSRSRSKSSSSGKSAISRVLSTSILIAAEVSGIANSTKSICTNFHKLYLVLRLV